MLGPLRKDKLCQPVWYTQTVKKEKGIRINRDFSFDVKEIKMENNFKVDYHDGEFVWQT